MPLCDQLAANTGIRESVIQWKFLKKRSKNPRSSCSQVDSVLVMNQMDLHIVNQETILGGTEMGLGGYPAFNSPQEIGDAEVKAGFNIILHATNHTLDRGLSGVNNTIEFWKTKHPDTTYLGIHDSEEDAKNIYVYEKQGFNVAVLNYTYGTNGIAIPSSAPYCVDTFDDEAKVRDDIRRAHKLADMVIVCPHWGTEYVYESTSYQDQWTNVFLEEGVDVVLGTHPHVIEPVKEFTRESDGHKMVVYYSLGNFVSNQDEIPRIDRKSTRLNSSHTDISRMPSSA